MCFSFETEVPLKRETVFAFFENPQRLELLYAGWSKIRVLKHQAHVRVGAETWVELTVAGFVPMVLGFRHVLFDPPFTFGEESIHGPFSRFVHIHEFEALGDKTIMRDLLDVRWRWQYGGDTILKRVVAPQITRMFHNRAQALERFVCDGTVARYASHHALKKKDE